MCIQVSNYSVMIFFCLFVFHLLSQSPRLSNKKSGLAPHNLGFPGMIHRTHLRRKTERVFVWKGVSGWMRHAVEKALSAQAENTSTVQDPVHLTLTVVNAWNIFPVYSRSSSVLWVQTLSYNWASSSLVYIQYLATLPLCMQSSNYLSDRHETVCVCVCLLV